MENRIHLKKILWIYILAFVLTAFSFHSKASIVQLDDVSENFNDTTTVEIFEEGVLDAIN